MLIQNPPPVKVDRTICQSTRACFVPPRGGVLNKKEFLFRSTLVPVTDKYLG